MHNNGSNDASFLNETSAADGCQYIDVVRVQIVAERWLISD